MERPRRMSKRCLGDSGIPCDMDSLVDVLGHETGVNIRHQIYFPFGPWCVPMDPQTSLGGCLITRGP